MSGEGNIVTLVIDKSNLRNLFPEQGAQISALVELPEAQGSENKVPRKKSPGRSRPTARVRSVPKPKKDEGKRRPKH